MPLSRILDPGQLAVATAVLDDYCRQAGIQPGQQRDAAARLIIDLYVAGIQSPGQLLAELKRSLPSDSFPSG